MLKLQNKKGGAYIIVFLFDMIAKLLMAVATVITIRILSVEEYAIYTKFNSISLLSSSIIGLGLTMAYVRFAAELVSRGKANSVRLFQLCSLFILVLSIASFAFIPISNKIFSTTTSVSLMALIYGGLLSLNKMNQSFFQVDERFSISGIITNIKNIALCVIIAALPILFKDVTDNQAIIATIISVVIAYFIGYYYISRRRSPQEDEAIDTRLFVRLLKECWWLIVYYLLICLFDQGCVIIMSHISTDTDIAVYGIASKYYMLMLTFLTSLMTVLRIRTSHQTMIDSKDHRREFTINWIKRIWWVAGSICLAVAIVSKPLLNFLNGDSYGEVVPTFNILVIGVFISYLFAPNVSVMMSGKRYKELCVLALLSFAINCLLCFVLIPHYGAIGAAIAVVVSNAALNIISTLIIFFDKDDKRDYSPGNR